MQREKLPDHEITNQFNLRDTMFVLTMPNTDLLAQAKEDLEVAMNIVVTNLTHFQKGLEKFQTPPKLIIIDECHYG